MAGEAQNGPRPKLGTSGSHLEAGGREEGCCWRTSGPEWVAGVACLL